MSDVYSNSSSVKVFPASTRTYDINSKLTTEHNLTEMVKLGSSKDSYVKSYIDDTLELMMQGYHFTVSGMASIATSVGGTKVYADIYVESGSDLLCNITDHSSPLDVTEGSTSVFKGLRFTSTEQTNSLLVLEQYTKPDGTLSWKVPDASQIGTNTKDVADKNTIMYSTASSGLQAGISIYTATESEGLPVYSGGYPLDGSICIIY